MQQPSVPVFQPHLGVDTVKAVTDAFDVGWIGMGAETRGFESDLQATLGTDRPVVATMTGTSALHLATRFAGVGPGDEVIMPSFNFVADVQAVAWTGATPVFADIDDRTLALDPSRVAEMITPRTRVIMPLHFAGIVGDLDAVYDLARTHRLRVIEDATHALGSTHGGRPIGSFGDITCFSFDPVKIITSLDGGAVVLPAGADVAALHRLRLLGIDKDTTERYRNRRAWDYDVLDTGFRDHMTNINAAIGRSQLRRLDEFVANRRRDARAYNEAFAGLDWLAVPRTDFAAVGPFIYTVRVAAGRRAALIDHLRTRGIATGIHFLPCHAKTFCRSFPRGPMDVTDRVSAEILTLPLWSSMPRDVRDRVIEAVVTFEPARPVATPGARARS
ncbi:MAG: DegT/DnrJ/EryC1/StrS family aminotransferase [Phycisphaerales bacterium]|nr:DegT/DnrJ/EryC1/StrS family aminotransferase [Phycisphaerales bacterium]NNM27639.1 DegT/DnrJ/EryC1/StrS family aminotransferase [Phycisphaerales bacterium]